MNRYSLRRRAKPRNTTFRIFLRWPIYIINPVDETKLSCYTSHRRSTTVSLETYPSIIAFDEVERKPNLTCGCQKLGSLRKVIYWEIHIPVRTPKGLPCLIFCRGMSRPVNWYRDYIIKACDTCDMTCEHVSRQGELWSFFLCTFDLSASVGFYTASSSTDFKQYLTGQRLSYLLRLQL